MKEKAAQKLIEAISRYGLENVSVLSKHVNIPVETARYMIWEELPKHHITIRLTLNLPKIGLGRWMLQVTPAQKSHADLIDAFLKASGALYVSRVVPETATLSILAIPFGEQYKLREQLAHLRSQNIVESYSLDEVEWVRSVTINPTMYDFRQREWNFTWDEVDKIKEPLATAEMKDDQPLSVDYKDILILKELQQVIPRTLSKLSRKIGLDQHNLRYHYKSHVRRAIQGYSLRLIHTDSIDTYSTILFTHEVQNEKSLAELRAISLRIPFSQKAWKTEKNYCWITRCPGRYTSGLVRYVNEKFVRIPGKIRMSYIDSRSEYLGTIPYNLFNEEKGAWMYEPKAPLQVVRR